jgi:hypothetical protein
LKWGVVNASENFLKDFRLKWVKGYPYVIPGSVIVNKKIPAATNYNGDTQLKTKG